MPGPGPPRPFGAFKKLLYLPRPRKRSPRERSLMSRRRSLSALFAAVTALLVVSIGQGTAARSTATAASTTAGSADNAILFASDGLRQDLVHKYVDEGVLPTFDNLLENGVEAAGNGLLQGFPPNTGVGWTTLATGTWPSEHGSTNNTFHRTG